jgi:hypothetical protein
VAFATTSSLFMFRLCYNPTCSTFCNGLMPRGLCIGYNDLQIQTIAVDAFLPPERIHRFLDWTSRTHDKPHVCKRNPMSCHGIATGRLSEQGLEICLRSLYQGIQNENEPMSCATTFTFSCKSVTNLLSLASSILIGIPMENICQRGRGIFTGGILSG